MILPPFERSAQAPCEKFIQISPFASISSCYGQNKDKNKRETLLRGHSSTDKTRQSLNMILPPFERSAQAPCEILIGIPPFN